MFKTFVSLLSGHTS